MNLGVGQDPFFDALSVLRYVRTAIDEAADVVLYNPQSQDYRKKFDPFPAPRKGIVRYDVVPPALRPRDPARSVGAASQLPGPSYFRRMALYAERGSIVEIREMTSVYSVLVDPRSHVAARIGDYGITLPSGSLHEQARYLVDAMNQTAQRTGLPQIRERTLDVRFVLGTVPAIHLPSGAKTGSLRGVEDVGQILYEKTG